MHWLNLITPQFDEQIRYDYNSCSVHHKFVEQQITSNHQ
jgi:hypothetical protein